MTKGRTTTYEERIEIVSYCVEHGNDFNSEHREAQMRFDLRPNSFVCQSMPYFP